MREVLDAQRAAFAASAPLSLDARRRALDALAHAIRRHQGVLAAAVSADFGHRSVDETRVLEILPTLDEIGHSRRHLRRWMAPTRVLANWQFWPSRAQILHQPKGVVGIISPWNYPILLTLTPLVAALAAGCHVMIKPSELTPATAQAMALMLAEAFGEDHVAIVQGDAAIAAAFAALPFDHLFFTGSARVGRMVMQAAAAGLVPVTLELGGKSPAIVHHDFPIDVAAERIIAAKIWNAGQTCVAPDYVLLPPGMTEDFATAAQAVARRRLVQPADYTQMIDDVAFARMQALVDDAAAKGAQIVRLAQMQGRAFPPTLILGATDDMVVMKQEVFGPLLPVMEVQSVADAITYVNAHDRPLALYYFDQDAGRVGRLLRSTTSGGVAVNDCVYHLVQHRLPFGGIGPSGMGAYHGKRGFQTFSHAKGVLQQNGMSSWALQRLTKPPYGGVARRVTDWLIGPAPAQAKPFDLRD